LEHVPQAHLQTVEGVKRSFGARSGGVRIALGVATCLSGFIGILLVQVREWYTSDARPLGASGARIIARKLVSVYTHN
jgi:hypothetical protein